jgi:hypothetical protein
MDRVKNVYWMTKGLLTFGYWVATGVVEGWREKPHNYPVPANYDPKHNFCVWGNETIN